MSKTIFIGGRLESKEKGNVVAGANAILDDTKGKKQNVINKDTDDELLRLEQSKQDNLTFDNAPTEDSTNPVTSGGVYTAEKALSDAIEAILLLIPSAATALNKLVDTNTMNSSISTATATFRGTYNAVSDLGLTYQATHAQIEAALDALGLTADNNDYVFVQVPVSDQSQDIAKTERYKNNGTNWQYEYDLNTSGFTAAQWAAINSTITLTLVQKLAALPTNAELLQALGLKQDVLTFDNAPTTDSNNPVKSGGIKSAIDTAVGDEVTARENADAALGGLIGDEQTRAEGVEGGLNTRLEAVEGSVTTIQGVIPSGATSSNKLVDNNSMTTYISTIIDNIDATFNVTSTDGHVTLAITQVNGVIKSVQLTTSDIASAAALNLKASQADLNALAGRVTTAEGNITSLTGRMTTAESDIDTLTALYNALQQSAPQVIQPTDTWPVANPSATTIYRVIDRVNTPPQYYSDYMWNGTSMVLMGTYNNAIDLLPTADSHNLVESGGVEKFHNQDFNSVAVAIRKNTNTIRAYTGDNTINCTILQGLVKFTFHCISGSYGWIEAVGYNDDNEVVISIPSTGVNSSADAVRTLYANEPISKLVLTTSNPQFADYIEVTVESSYTIRNLSSEHKTIADKVLGSFTIKSLNGMIDVNAFIYKGDIGVHIPSVPNACYRSIDFKDKSGNVIGGSNGAFLIEANTEYNNTFAISDDCYLITINNYNNVLCDITFKADINIDILSFIGKDLNCVRHINRFDPTAIYAGHYINNDTYPENADWFTTDFIPVDDIDKVEVIGYGVNGWGAWYDENKNWLGGAEITQNIPNGVYYFRWCCQNTRLNTLQIGSGLVQSEYTPFRYFELYNQKIRAKNVIGLNNADFDIKPLIPSVVYLRTNQEFSIWYWNIINYVQAYENGNYSIRCEKKVGNTYSNIGSNCTFDKFNYISESTAEFDIEIRIIDTYSRSIVASKVVHFVVIEPDDIVNKSPKIVLLGDSYTDGHNVTRWLYQFLLDEGLTPQAIGVNNGWENYKDDAWSGYGIDWFYGSAYGYHRSDRPASDDIVIDGVTYTKNEFYNPDENVEKFDFSYYMQTYHSGVNSVDFVIFNIGLNDTEWALKSDAELSDLLDKLDYMIQSVHTFDANTKIILCQTTPLTKKDACVSNMGNSWLTAATCKNNNERWNNVLLEHFDTAEYRTAKVFIAPLSSNYDTEHAIYTTTIQTDKFDSSITEVITNDIHPNEIGSKYIADTLTNTVCGLS